jgi:hypothetical protein
MEKERDCGPYTRALNLKPLTLNPGNVRGADAAALRAGGCSLRSMLLFAGGLRDGKKRVGWGRQDKGPRWGGRGSCANRRGMPPLSSKAKHRKVFHFTYTYTYTYTYI